MLVYFSYKYSLYPLIKCIYTPYRKKYTVYDSMLETSSLAERKICDYIDFHLLCNKIN